MKTYRVLGIVWFLICCLCVYWSVRGVLTASPPYLRGHLMLLLIIVAQGLVYVAGAIASILLFRGVAWARWIVGVIALMELPACIDLFRKGHQVLPLGCTFSAVALVSLVLLFWPGRKTPSRAVPDPQPGKDHPEDPRSNAT